MNAAFVSPQVGIIVAQLGTPDAPTAQAVRPYLREFLSDRRVIDYNPLFWQPILRGIILLTRPRRSARLYQRIWTDGGSPLLVISQQQVAGLQVRLGENYRVVLGMRYGNPSLKDAVRTLEAEGINRIVVFPMYPQYSSTTSASIYDGVYEAAAGRRSPVTDERKRFVPTLRFVHPYYRHPCYIAALCEQVRAAVRQHGAPDRYLFTFHGIPNRYIETGDPYRSQCETTARLLAEALALQPEQWHISFQSQFGPEKWLEPYTSEALESMGHQGVERLAVFAPGFVADCLETLDELGNEGREEFVAGGGKAANYHLISCLNDQSQWLDAMADIVRQETLGWV